MVDVLISDKGSSSYDQNSAYFANIDAWAQKHLGTKYLGYYVQDVSDVSLDSDEIASYTFEDEQSANWFKLVWVT